LIAVSGHCVSVNNFCIIAAPEQNDVCDIVGQCPSVEIRAGILSNSLQHQ
jgi:hypothetical protein